MANGSVHSRQTNRAGEQMAGRLAPCADAFQASLSKVLSGSCMNFLLFDSLLIEEHCSEKQTSGKSMDLKRGGTKEKAQLGSKTPHRTQEKKE